MTVHSRLRIFARMRDGVIVVSALLLVFCAGCGERQIFVVGTVTFNGQPVNEGSIVLEPADGKGATAGGKIESGRYSVSGEEGVMAGKKIARIIAVRKTGRKIDAGPPAGTMVDEIEKYIPPIYNRKSTLTCEVVLGANEHDFHLKSQN